MLRSVDDDYMPWLGFLLGQTPGSIWYWCADQVTRGRVEAKVNMRRSLPCVANIIESKDAEEC